MAPSQPPKAPSMDKWTPDMVAAWVCKSGLTHSYYLLMNESFPVLFVPHAQMAGFVSSLSYNVQAVRTLLPPGELFAVVVVNGMEFQMYPNPEGRFHSFCIAAKRVPRCRLSLSICGIFVGISKCRG